MIRLLPGGRRARLLYAAISGLALSATFPNLSLVVLLPVALLPLLAAFDGVRSARDGALLGVSFGMVFWIGTIPWIAYTVQKYGEVPWPAAGLALVISAAILTVPMVVLGLLVVTAVTGARAPSVRRPLAIALGWPAVWVVQEGLRTYVFGGFPWALVAYPLAELPAFLQSAAYGGVLLTSALVVLVNGLLYLAITGDSLKVRVAFLLGAVVIVEGGFVWGARRVARVDRAPAASVLLVGVVQPNVAQETRWEPEQLEKVYQELLEQTRRLARMSSPRPQLILWPESATPVHWPWSSRLRQDVLALCRELDVAILLSTVWSDQPEKEDAPFYNAALLVTRDGPVLPAYYKQRLVPFGEYVPLPSLLRMVRPISRAIPSSFSAGDQGRVLPLGEWRLGGAVCYEVVYPWVLHGQTRLGADLLFSLTNDAWYGTAGARRQHWQAAVFRSVETGRPLVRAAITGISGLVLPSGRSFPIVGPDEKGAFVVPVGRPARSTLFVRLPADASLAVCSLIVLALILRGFRRLPSDLQPER